VEPFAHLGLSIATIATQSIFPPSRFDRERKPKSTVQLAVANGVAPSESSLTEGMRRGRVAKNRVT
jgi:hypothetical protein